VLVRSAPTTFHNLVVDDFTSIIWFFISLKGTWVTKYKVYLILTIFFLFFFKKTQIYFYFLFFGKKMLIFFFFWKKLSIKNGVEKFYPPPPPLKWLTHPPEKNLAPTYDTVIWLGAETRNTRPPVSNPIMWRFEKQNSPPKLFFLTLFREFVSFFQLSTSFHYSTDKQFH
jgi:hypothetical protein